MDQIIKTDINDISISYVHEKNQLDLSMTCISIMRFFVVQDLF